MAEEPAGTRRVDPPRGWKGLAWKSPLEITESERTAHGNAAESPRVPVCPVRLNRDSVRAVRAASAKTRGGDGEPRRRPRKLRAAVANPAPAARRPVSDRASRRAQQRRTDTARAIRRPAGDRSKPRPRPPCPTPPPPPDVARPCRPPP